MIYSIILIIILIFIPAVCLPSYVIQLKDGAQFITDRYWNEGNQIKFYLYGGILGVDKTKVEKITESDLLFPDFEVVEKKASEKIVEPEPNNKERKEEKKSTEKIDVDYYRSKKETLTNQIQAAQEKIKKANRDGKPAAKGEAKKEYLDLRNQLKKLKLELMDKNTGVLPDWW